MQIRIATGSNSPIYRQIVDQIRRAMASGELPVGEAVPSVRQLAKELVVNPNTVNKAYAELVRDGVLESHQGRGFFVAKRRAVYTKAERLRRLDEALEGVVSAAVTLDFAEEEVLERLRTRWEKLASTKN